MHCICKKLVLAILLMVTHMALHAQVEGYEHFRFKKITKKEGLSNNTIFAMTQDDYGFLWFGTRNGLNRYDGYRIKSYNFDTDTSSVSNDIRSLLYDNESSSLWIGTQSGLVRFFLANSKFDKYLISKDIQITSIVKGESGKLLLGTSNGVYHFDQSNDFLPLEDQRLKNLSISTLNSIKGEIWIATSTNKIYVLSERDLKFKGLASDLYPELIELTGKKITTIQSRSDNEIWFGTERSGVFQWNKILRTLTAFHHVATDPKSISSDKIRTMCLDKSGRIWIGTHLGLNVFDETKENFTRIINDDSSFEGLSNNSIRSMHIDSKGGLWIGTYYRGVNYTDESLMRFNVALPHSNILNDDRNIISTIASGKSGKIWIGTEGQGLATWNLDNKEFDFVSIDESLQTLNIKAIFPHNKHLWIGTYQEGLIKYNLDNGRFDRFVENPSDNQSIPGKSVYDICQRNGFMWFATFEGGLSRYNIKNNSFLNFQHSESELNSIISNECKVLHEDKDKDLWVGTTHGLSKIKDNDSEKVKFENYLENQNVLCLSSIENGSLWIGTFGTGLYLLAKDSNKLTNYGVDEGLPGNTVYSIVPHNESLWIFTNNGIGRMDVETETITSFGNTVGLENLEFSPNASFNYRDDLLLVGSNTGLVFFEPVKIKTSQFIPPLVISDFKTVKGQSQPDLLDISENNRTITLDYNHGNLHIEFSSLDYSSPTSNKYAYRMKGLDEDWIHTTGEPEAAYTLQNEGNYVFEFKGSNSDGFWNEEVKAINILVHPPWYRSSIAKSIYLLLFVLFLYGLYRILKLYNSYQLEHVSKVEQARVHDMKIRFFTNITHELRTPLTLMLGPLQDTISNEDILGPLRTKLEGIHKNVQRLSLLVNQLLDFRKLETDHLQLRVKEADIVDLLQEIFYAFQEEAQKRNIEYHFDSSADSGIMWYDADKIEKVFFNILSNAFKFTPNYGFVKIQIRDNGDFIQVKVMDNGPGIESSMRDQVFERFYERGSTNYSSEGIGIGLYLSKQMVELHKGNIYVEDTDGSGNTGTTFVVEFPKGSAHFDESSLVATQDDKFVSDEDPQMDSSEEQAKGDKSLKILIVEDDLEVSEYVKSLFIDEYQVLQAKNGVQGVSMACRHIPDLIISDVMMPEMDGITMCREIKMTIETSHIPIILLTARSATAYRIGGLETGADDYIVKPFNSQELTLKVRNVIGARNAYLEKLSRTHNFEPKKIAVTSTDEKFLDQLMEVAEKNIENSNLTTEALADEMFVSRALLFAKIKALTGQTPKGFIKNLRLKRAAQLLEDSDLTVSQVAYKSGFRDYRYFSKLFKNRYNVSPKDYSRNYKNEIVH